MRASTSASSCRWRRTFKASSTVARSGSSMWINEAPARSRRIANSRTLTLMSAMLALSCPRRHLCSTRPWQQLYFDPLAEADAFARGRDDCETRCPKHRGQHVRALRPRRTCVPAVVAQLQLAPNGMGAPRLLAVFLVHRGDETVALSGGPAQRS